jgi:hypothetical protein
MSRVYQRFSSWLMCASIRVQSLGDVLQDFCAVPQRPAAPNMPTPVPRPHHGNDHVHATLLAAARRCGAAEESADTHRQQPSVRRSQGVRCRTVLDSPFYSLVLGTPFVSGSCIDTVSCSRMVEVFNERQDLGISRGGRKHRYGIDSLPPDMRIAATSYGRLAVEKLSTPHVRSLIS